MFLMETSYDHEFCTFQNTVKSVIFFEILLQFKITVSFLIHFKIKFIPVMAKLNFQQALFQSSVSHDPSEIILIC